MPKASLGVEKLEGVFFFFFWPHFSAIWASALLAGASHSLLPMLVLVSYLNSHVYKTRSPFYIFSEHHTFCQSKKNDLFLSIIVQCEQEGATSRPWPESWHRTLCVCLHMSVCLSCLSVSACLFLCWCDCCLSCQFSKCRKLATFH